MTVLRFFFIKIIHLFMKLLFLCIRQKSEFTMIFFVVISDEFE